MMSIFALDKRQVIYRIGPGERLRRPLRRGRMHRRVVPADVEELRRGALLRAANGHFPLCKRTADFRIGIVHVPRDDGMLRTNDDAGWLQAYFNPVRTVMTLGGCPGIRIDVDGIVWARLEAGFAADARVTVELDDPVFALIHRAHWTDAHTGGIGAVIAPGHLEMSSNVRKCPGFDRFDPGAINSERDLVLALARSRTRVTADTRLVVDYETEVHEQSVVRRPWSVVTVVYPKSEIKFCCLMSDV